MFGGKYHTSVRKVLNDRYTVYVNVEKCVAAWYLEKYNLESYNWILFFILILYHLIGLIVHLGS